MYLPCLPWNYIHYTDKLSFTSLEMRKYELFRFSWERNSSGSERFVFKRIESSLTALTFKYCAGCYKYPLCKLNLFPCHVIIIIIIVITIIITCVNMNVSEMNVSEDINVTWALNKCSCVPGFHCRRTCSFIVVPVKTGIGLHMATRLFWLLGPADALVFSRANCVVKVVGQEFRGSGRGASQISIASNTSTFEKKSPQVPLLEQSRITFSCHFSFWFLEHQPGLCDKWLQYFELFPVAMGCEYNSSRRQCVILNSYPGGRGTADRRRIWLWGTDARCCNANKHLTAATGTWKY